MRKKNRLLIISNRLPITVKKKDSGLDFLPSSGGVVSGLEAFYRDYNAVWLGWPGAVSEKNLKKVESKLSSRFNYYPIFIPRSLSEKYYEGCCNNTIWPLFHSFQNFAEYSKLEWESYKKANLLFLEAVARIIRPGDVIWVHDYQLMMLPKLLRKRFPDIPIGFFLHIPFPPFDIFRALPQHRELLESLLAADLVGFHTYDYAQAFLGSARRLLGFESELGQIMVNQRVAQVDVFPIGIDFAKFSGRSRDKKVKSEVSKISRRIAAHKLIFSVSRLDYTKGIPQSVEAVGEFFERNPQWHGKIVYLLVVVPSREKVKRYASLKREIDELVGKINSKYGTLDWLPIRYIYRNLKFSELVALYSRADVALVTPLRDGMNLIAKEYVATKTDGKGVLILSEMAGAAKEMLEALVVNPNNIEEVVQALEKALMMSEGEQKERNKIMRARLRNYDVKRWADKFLRKLSGAAHLSKALRIRKLNPAGRKKLVRHYSESAKRLIVLDYDGTLVPFVDKPQKAKPSAEIIDLLEKLTLPSKNEVVILSGRDKETLQKWFGALKIMLVAEHGAWVKNQKSKRWRPIGAVDDSWKKQIRPVMQLFVGRIPGSFIEEKDFSLAWHYRKANVDIGSEAAREMIDTLINLTANLDLNVLPSNKVVEIKSSEVSKGTFYLNYLADRKSDFILAMGDDWTDESLFNVVPESAYSIHIGSANSSAKFNLESTQEVILLLQELADSKYEKSANDSFKT